MKVIDLLADQRKKDVPSPQLPRETFSFFLLLHSHTLTFLNAGFLWLFSRGRGARDNLLGPSVSLSCVVHGKTGLFFLTFWRFDVLFMFSSGGRKLSAEFPSQFEGSVSAFTLQEG